MSKRTKKEVQGILDGYKKEYKALEIMYPKKANLAELEIILSNANVAIASYNSLAEQKKNETGQEEGIVKPVASKNIETAPKKDDKKAAEKDEAAAPEITDEMTAVFKDEASPSFCGTFGGCSLDSPACAECGEIMNDRQTLCLAITAQAAAKVTPKATRKGGNGKKSEYKNYIQTLIEEGGWSRTQIVDAFVANFPEAAKSTVTTYLSDSQSEKYCPFPFICKIDKKTKLVEYTEKAALGRSAFAKANSVAN